MKKKQGVKQKWSKPSVKKLKFNQTQGSASGAAEGTELFSSPVS